MVLHQHDRCVFLSRVCYNYLTEICFHAQVTFISRISYFPSPSRRGGRFRTVGHALSTCPSQRTLSCLTPARHLSRRPDAPAIGHKLKGTHSESSRAPTFVQGAFRAGLLPKGNHAAVCSRTSLTGGTPNKTASPCPQIQEIRRPSCSGVVCS